MEQNVKNFLNVIIHGNGLTMDYLKEAAKTLLLEEAKKEIRSLFDFHLNHSWNKDEHIKTIKARNKVCFISNVSGSTTLSDYINENFEQLDLILDILNEYIEELEKPTEEGEENA